MNTIIEDNYYESIQIDLQSLSKYLAYIDISQARLAKYRSNFISNAAAEVFPQSCETHFSEDVYSKFNKLTSIRNAISVDSSPVKDIRFNATDPLSLLVFDWRASLCDGAAIHETYGFLNDDWFPGWDTWLRIITFKDGRDCYLLSWVPPEVCREVNVSIGLDAAKCMSWLTFNSNSREPVLLGWGKRWQCTL